MKFKNKYFPRAPRGEVDPDVFIEPRFLELEFGLGTELGYKLGLISAKIGRKRWPKVIGLPFLGQRQC
jgi:hypothetical protein